MWLAGMRFNNGQTESQTQRAAKWIKLWRHTVLPPHPHPLFAPSLTYKHAQIENWLESKLARAMRERGERNTKVGRLGWRVREGKGGKKKTRGREINTTRTLLCNSSHPYACMHIKTHSYTLHAPSHTQTHTCSYLISLFSLSLSLSLGTHTHYPCPSDCCRPSSGGEQSSSEFCIIEQTLTNVQPPLQ